MMGLPDGPKSFRIGLVVLIQYRLWQTPSHPASHVAVAITLNAKASSLKIEICLLKPVVSGFEIWFEICPSLDSLRLNLTLRSRFRWEGNNWNSVSVKMARKRGCEVIMEVGNALVSKKQKGHWSQGLLASITDPNQVVAEDDMTVVIKDKYPKVYWIYNVVVNVAKISAVYYRVYTAEQHTQHSCGLAQA